MNIDLTEPLIAQAHVTLGWLQEALGWLDDLLEPGPMSRTARPLTDQARERMDRLALEERADRYITARRGLSALAPTDAPLRLDVLGASTLIYGRLQHLCVEVAAHLHSSYLGRQGREAGTAAALAYLSGDGPSWALRLRSWTGALDAIRDHNMATRVVAELDRLNQVARDAADVPDILRVHLDPACPACGRYSLYGDITAPDPRHWYVICVQSWDTDTGREYCRCTGVGCACWRRRCQEGSRHVWCGMEETGVIRGLADRSEVGPAPVVAGCSCACHVGGAYRPACDVVGGCGTIGCDGHGQIVAVAA